MSARVTLCKALRQGGELHIIIIIIIIVVVVVVVVVVHHEHNCGISQYMYQSNN